MAVVGFEKLVEKLEDVVPILTALPESATGQLLTSYVSIITGPVAQHRRDAQGPPRHPDGQPAQDMAADPKFREALQCIRCASCLNVCPVFRLVGGHVFGKTYTGGIGAILTAWFDALEDSEDIQALCIQCGSCKEVCPGGIDIPALILELRRRVAAKSGRPLLHQAIFSVVNDRRLFHAMLRTASVAQAPFRKGRFIRHLPFFLAGLTEGRSLPAIAPRPFRDLVKELEQPAAPREKAAFYAGCLIDFAYPETGLAVVKVLNRAGVEVVFPEGQTCCGAPARYAGASDVAARNARDNVAALLEANAEVRWVVSACPTCTVALRGEFAASLRSEGDEAGAARADQLAAKVIDFSTLVQQLVAAGRLELPPAGWPGPVTYHDSCHLKRTLRAERAPRALLARAGVEVKEMSESDVCCGMGGSYSMKLPEISAPMLARKLRCIAETGAATVATDCPGCVLQLRGGLDQAGSPVDVRHTAELLADALG